MKLKCSTAKLLEAMNIVDYVIPGRSTIPILTNVKITAFKKQKIVELCGTDLEHSVVYKLPSEEIEEEGTLVLPSSRLKAIVKEISPEDEEVSIESQGTNGIVKTKNSFYNLVGASQDEFPKIPDFREHIKVEIDTTALQQMIEKTIFSVSGETTRTPITGELIEIHPNRIRFVATDAKRLAYVEHKRTVENLTAPLKLIVSTKTLEIISRTLSEETKKITISASNSQIKAETENVTIISQLLEGSFPDYEAVIPSETNIKCEIEKNKFISALRRVNLMTSEKIKATKLSFQKGILTLIAKNPELGEAKTQIPVNYEQRDFDIIFNPDYLLDYLKTVTEPQISIYFIDKSAPALLKSSPEHLYILMPMTLEL